MAISKRNLDEKVPQSIHNWVTREGLREEEKSHLGEA